MRAVAFSAMLLLPAPAAAQDTACATESRYTYAAEVIRVVDGDTFDALVDLGFSTFRKMRFRMAVVDTPERGEPNYDEATALTKSLVLEQEVVLHSEKDRTGGFGRYLAHLCVGSVSVGEELMRRGLAVPYRRSRK